jgi:hypothetical protein
VRLGRVVNVERIDQAVPVADPPQPPCPTTRDDARDEVVVARPPDQVRAEPSSVIYT